jgi:murein DD-endopeptidase MepM/ murein hydrolase activator NlpD
LGASSHKQTLKRDIRQLNTLLSLCRGQYLDIPSNNSGRNTYTSSEVKSASRSNAADIRSRSSDTNAQIVLTSSNLASSVDELNLAPNQRVLAAVVAYVQDQNLELGKELKVTSEGKLVDAKQTQLAGSSNTDTQQAKTFAHDAPIKTELREVLLKIDSKFLLVETNSNIKPNSSVQIYVDSAGLLKLTNTVAPEALSSLDLLRSAISKILPQQVSLESGIQQLFQRAGRPIDMASIQTEPALKPQVESFIAAAALKILTSKIMDFSALNPQTVANNTGAASTTSALPNATLTQILTQAKLQTIALLNPEAKLAPSNVGAPQLDPNSALAQQVKSWLTSSGLSYEKKAFDTQLATQSLPAANTSTGAGSAKIALTKHEAFSNIIELMMRTIDSQMSPKSSAKESLEQSKQSLTLLAESFKTAGIDYQVKLLSQENLKAVTHPEALLNSPKFSDAVSQLRQTINALESIQNLLNKAISDIAQTPLAAATSPPVTATTVIAQIEPFVLQSQKLESILLQQQGQLIQFLQTQVSQDYKHPASDVALNHPQLLTSIALAAPTASADLKETLMQLTGAIQALNNKGIEGLLPRADTNEKAPALRGLSESSLLFRPFDFPQLKHDIAKVQASLSDQELSTGQVLKLLAGMLNRINFNQLNSLYQAQGGADPNLTQSWHFELPFLSAQQTHVASLRIDKEKHPSKEEKDDQGTEKETVWKLSLAFNFENLGPIFIEASIAPPVIKSKIWAENDQTQKLIAQEKNQFTKQLEGLGLTVEDIQCLHGKPNKAKTVVARGFVDIKA